MPSTKLATVRQTNHRIIIPLSLCLVLLNLSSLAQTEYSTRDLKNGKFKDDNSFIYSLPFAINKRVFLIQAYESKFSHQGERALDFKIKSGTKIFAARGGIVIATRNDSEEGGLKPENLSDGNYISIQHADSSIAHYWHLQKKGTVVNIGDTILIGQHIGFSGNTGYSAFPHLHFEVVGKDQTGNPTQLATRFYTQEGIRYLTPGRFYRRRR